MLSDIYGQTVLGTNMCCATEELLLCPIISYRPMISTLVPSIDLATENRPKLVKLAGQFTSFNILNI